MKDSAHFLPRARFAGKQNFAMQTVGNMGFYYGIRGKSHFRLIAIAVRTDYQKQGYGKLLLNQLFSYCTENGLSRVTLRTHQGGAAEAFWKHMGAEITGQKEGDWEMEIKVKGAVEKPAISKTYNSPRWTNEIADCSLPMTFDTYSNCSFGCVYCFSQYQRGIGKTKEAYLNKVVRSVDPEKIRKIFTLEKETQFSGWIAQRRPIQWGGLSDQFDGFERKYGVTLELLKMFRQMKYPICFSTKSAWVFHDPRYTEVFEGMDNWNMKFSIITLDEKMAAKTNNKTEDYEKNDDDGCSRSIPLLGSQCSGLVGQTEGEGRRKGQGESGEQGGRPGGQCHGRRAEWYYQDQQEV